MQIYKPNTVIVAIIVLLSIIIPSQVTHAQWRSFKLKNKAEYLINQGYIYEALPYLEKYCINKPKDLDAAFDLAYRYQEIRDYAKASEWFLKTYKGDSTVYLMALFEYGKMQKMLGAYEEANRAFLSFKDQYKGRDATRELKKLLEQEIIGCQIADSLIRNPREAIIIHMDTSINKLYSEFSPIMLDDSTLLYASSRLDEIYYTNQVLPRKSFHIARRSNEEWYYLNPWSFLDFDEYYDITGNGCFSEDKNRFYFTHCFEGNDHEILCNIYMSKKVEGDWSKPERLKSDINIPNYTSTQPAVVNDPRSSYKEIMYFVSNRPEGEGGLDIYFTVYNKRKDEFSEVRNAGKKINTPANEMTVFIDPNSGSMYFSSEGWSGLGGLDIFKTNGSKRSWTAPKNVGSPFNSSADDLYFTTGTNPQEGFFISNRKGGVSYQDFTCCDDIYYYKWKKYIQINIQGSIDPQMGDNELEMLPDLLNPRLQLYIMDQETGEFILAKERELKDKEFEVNLETDEVYKIIVEADNYEAKSFDVSTRNYVLSDTLNIGFSLNFKPDQPIILDDILFEFDKFDLPDESKRFLDEQLVEVLLKKPDIRIEISAHTDNLGDRKYNLELSQKRAESVVEYLISRGIEKSRLKAKGYGESRPIAPNEYDDGTDNPEGRAKNRRVELRILD